MTLHLLRHGPTEMAAYMALHKYGSPHQEPLRDPMMYDTVLTREGRRRVQQAAGLVAALRPRPEAVLVSPLTRCLQTAVLACEELFASGVTVEAVPLLRERLTLSSEVGRPPAELRAEFPGVCFPADMREVWWYAPDIGAGPEPALAADESVLRPRSITQEPKGAYEERLVELRRLLAARPERCILLVSHWSVLRALGGCDLQPGELASVDAEL